MDYTKLTAVTLCIGIIYGLTEGTDGLYSLARLHLKDRRALRSATHCPPCNTHNCPIVLQENCAGRIIKDNCDCCPVCDITRLLTTSHPNGTRDSQYEAYGNDHEACKQLDCSRQQICLLNIQGIPVCRCPSAIYCKDRPKKEVCSIEDKTYKSLCYLKMEACTLGKKITVKHKGPCEHDILTREERKRLKEEKLEERAKRQRLKKDKKGKKNRKGKNGEKKGKKGDRSSLVDKFGGIARQNKEDKTSKVIKEELRRERRRHRRRLKQILKREKEQHQK